MTEIPARGGPTLLTTAGTPQTIVTAGAAGTWTLLRDLAVTNETASAVTVSIGIGTTNTDAAGKRRYTKWPIQPGSALLESLFGPLFGSGSTPDLLYAVCDTANGATITVAAVTGP